MPDWSGELFTGLSNLVDNSEPLLKGKISQPSGVSRKKYRKFSPKIQHILSVVDGHEERVITLDATTYSIGRHPANAIVLKIDMHVAEHVGAAEQL